MTDLNTEGPTTGQSTPAGGVDPARDDAREAELDGADAPASTPAPSPDQVQDQSEDDVTTSGEPADAEDDAATAPTPEEQAELDQMVDYTVKKGDEFDGTPVRAGDVIKLGKDHPLLEGDDADTSSEDGQ